MGILFAIVSPFIDTVINYIDKFALEKYEISPMVITIYSCIIATVVGFLVGVFNGFHLIDTKSAIIIISSGFITAIFLLPYLKAISLDDVSTIGPFFQSVPVFVLILSFIFLGEKLRPQQYLGSFIIIASGFIIAVEEINIKMFRVRKSLSYTLLACFLLATSITLFKFGVTSSGFWSAIPYEGLGNLLALIVLLQFKSNRKVVKKFGQNVAKKLFCLLLVSEVLFISSRYILFFALSLVPASLVSIFQGLQPVYMLLVGLGLSIFFPQILKEGIDKKTIMLKLISSAFIVLGLYFIFV